MRTAFEYARSLWSLDPWNDPHGALMHLDFLIIKAEQYDWFMDIENTWEGIRNEVPSLLPLDVRPGWKWSKALALKVMGTKKGGGEVGYSVFPLIVAQTHRNGPRKSSSQPSFPFPRCWWRFHSL